MVELKLPTMPEEECLGECMVEIDEYENSFDEGYFAPDDEGSDKALMAGELLKGDILHSTTYHRAVIASCATLCAALVAQGCSEVDAPQAVTTVLAAYVLSDLGSGVFHWSVDNYGSDKTPLFGGVIAAFQGHHLFPWTITKREFCNNVHKVATPTVPLLGALLASPAGGSAEIFMGVFTALVVLSQQFHSWSHTRKSQLPPAVVALQDAGVLLSRKAHGAHHRVPFNGNYCIVSGLWNDTLDGSGFFKALETRVHAATGVEARCWSDEPDYSWLTGLETSGKSQTAARQ